MAISDEGGKLATPLGVISVGSGKATLGDILDVMRTEGVQRVVVGLPLNMDGTLGPQAKAALVWGGELAGKCGLPVVFVDERLSSFQAEQQLVERKRSGERLTRRMKKKRLDALAAAGFLQAFLDGKLPPISVT